MMESKKEESPAVREIYTKIFTDSWDKDINVISKAMPIKIAREIKEWRKDHTWRSIASYFVEMHPAESLKFNIVAGNQISGMQLCDAAMKKLKETIDQGWN